MVRDVRVVEAQELHGAGDLRGEDERADALGGVPVVGVGGVVFCEVGLGGEGGLAGWMDGGAGTDGVEVVAGGAVVAVQRLRLGRTGTISADLGSEHDERDEERRKGHPRHGRVKNLKRSVLAVITF